jgi:23S rRNA pseudoU1915 N3-methylase RlmH
MGNMHTVPKANFEKVQNAIKQPSIILLINTLPENQQDCLIQNTIVASKEEEVMNKYLQLNQKNIQIILYGKNDNDETVYKKYKQLLKLGFTNVQIYMGGMFEWLLLQDIYGYETFMTTKRELDFLKFKP